MEPLFTWETSTCTTSLTNQSCKSAQEQSLLIPSNGCRCCSTHPAKNYTWQWATATTPTGRSVPPSVGGTAGSAHLQREGCVRRTRRLSGTKGLMSHVQPTHDHFIGIKSFYKTFNWVVHKDSSWWQLSRKSLSRGSKVSKLHLQLQGVIHDNL